MKNYSIFNLYHGKRRSVAFKVILSLCLSVIVFSCFSKQKTMKIYFNWDCLDEFMEDCNKQKINLYKRTLNIFDTINYECDCFDSLVVEDINLNIIIGDTSSFPGGCMDGRITSSGWLLTGADTLCWACYPDTFFLKKGKNYYEAIVDTAFSLRFEDILNSVEDSLHKEYIQRLSEKRKKIPNIVPPSHSLD